MVLISLFPVPAAPGDDFDMSRVNEEVEGIVGRGLHVIESAIDMQNLLDSPELAGLRKQCLEDWERIAGATDQIRHGEIGRELVFLALSELPASSYMTLLESITRSYVDDSVSEMSLRNLLFNQGTNGAFVIDNCRHARVVAMLETIKAKASNGEFKQRITRVLSGEEKANLDDYREAHEGLGEGDIPVVILEE